MSIVTRPFVEIVSIPTVSIVTRPFVEIVGMTSVNLGVTPCATTVVESHGGVQDLPIPFALSVRVVHTEKEDIEWHHSEMYRS